MPVFLDGSDLTHSAARGSSSDHPTLRRRLNPVTTPPGEFKIQARAAQEEVRQGATEGQEEDREDGDTMPWFWGNVDEVGSSPFDHLPELDLEDDGDDRQKGKRVLFLTGTSQEAIPKQSCLDRPRLTKSFDRYFPQTTTTTWNA
jgi:hypothetical protein